MKITKIKKAGFSLVELSIVIFTIGLLMVAVVKSSDLIAQARLTTARELTTNSPVQKINDLVLWYETTMPNSFIASEMKDGGSVSTWKEISGYLPNNSADGYQATGANQPIYVTRGINNLPSLQFDGASTYFDVTNTTATAVSPSITIFAVFKPTPTTTNTSTAILAKDYGDSLSNPAYEIKYNEASGMITIGIDDSSNTDNGNLAVTAVSYGTSVICSATYDYINYTNGFKLYLNGTLNSTANAGTGLAVGINSAALKLGRQKTGFADRFFKGQIAEIIIYKRALSTQERQDVERYLGKKWGITVP